MTGKTSRRHYLEILGGTVAGLAVGGAAGYLLSPSPTPTELKKVIFRLDWILMGKHAMHYVPLDKGWYEDAGLDVTVARGSGSIATIGTVDKGMDTFGHADTSNVMIARSKGAKVKEIAMFHSKTPFSFISLKETGIEEPKDLEGKKLAMSPGGSSLPLIPYVCELMGIDFDKIEFVWMDPAAALPALLAHTVDFTASYYISQDPPVLEAEGIPYNVMKWYDYGFDVYSNGLITRDELIENDPDLVRKFVQVSMRGCEWASEHPDEAAEILCKYEAGLDLEAMKIGSRYGVDALWGKEQEEHCLGWMDHERMVRTRDVVCERVLEIPKEDVVVEECYTNEFLECY